MAKEPMEKMNMGKGSTKNNKKPISNRANRHNLKNNRKK
jgi:hypothetical protein